MNHGIPASHRRKLPGGAGRLLLARLVWPADASGTPGLMRTAVPQLLDCRASALMDRSDPRASPIPPAAIAELTSHL